jgi:hypothetical protein
LETPKVRFDRGPRVPGGAGVVDGVAQFVLGGGDVALG